MDIVFSAIIFDLDGTLADCSHRAHLIEEKNYDEYYKHCLYDKPITPIISLFNHFHDEWWRYNGPPVHIVTGRREDAFNDTKKWLELYTHWHSTSRIYMRPKNDFRQDDVLKKDLAKQMGLIGMSVLCFDDRDRVVKMWRSLGFTCCQVADGNY